MKKLIISIITILSLLTGCANEKAASIGIIGGSDGPTSVFVAGKISSLEIAGVVFVILVLVIAIIYLIKKK